MSACRNPSFYPLRAPSHTHSEVSFPWPADYFGVGTRLPLSVYCLRHPRRAPLPPGTKPPSLLWLGGHGPRDLRWIPVRLPQCALHDGRDRFG